MRGALLGVGLVLALLLTGCDRDARAFKMACQRAALAKLQAPATAKFGNALDVAPPGMGDGIRRLDPHGLITYGGQGAWYGYVDAANAFGASVRSYFICVQDEAGMNVAFGDIDEVLTY